MAALHQRGERLVAAARERYTGSQAQSVVGRLKDLNVLTETTVFGSAFLLSALPLMVLLSSFANRRIEEDLASHLGLNEQATRVVGQLFHISAQRSALAVVVAVLLAIGGTLGVAGSVQKFYERILGGRHRLRTDPLRLLLWIAALCVWLALDAVLARVAHRLPGGMVLEGIAVLVVTTAFFWWSMHLLLGGARSWPSLVRPALVTAVLWLVLEGGSALYFSTAITNDNRLYGAVGVIFSLMTWFVLVAVVVVLGALLGEVWQERHTASRPQPDSGTQPSTNAASR